MEFLNVGERFEIPLLHANLSTFNSYFNFITTFRNTRNQLLAENFADFKEMTETKLEEVVDMVNVGKTMHASAEKMSEASKLMVNVNLETYSEEKRILLKMAGLKKRFPYLKKNCYKNIKKLKGPIFTQISKAIESEYEQKEELEVKVPIDIQKEFSFLEYMMHVFSQIPKIDDNTSIFQNAARHIYDKSKNKANWIVNSGEVG